MTTTNEIEPKANDMGPPRPKTARPNVPPIKVKGIDRDNSEKKIIPAILCSHFIGTGFLWYFWGGSWGGGGFGGLVRITGTIGCDGNTAGIVAGHWHGTLPEGLLGRTYMLLGRRI